MQRELQSFNKASMQRCIWDSTTSSSDILTFYHHVTDENVFSYKFVSLFSASLKYHIYVL